MTLRPASGTAQQLVGELREWLGAEQEPAPLIVATSGSSGQPKRVVLSRSAVRSAAAATAATLGEGQWVLALPPSYVAGVMVLVRSLVAGRDPVLAEHGSIPDPGPDWFISLVPTQVARAIAAPDQAAQLAGYRAVLLGGGPIDPGLRRAAESAGIRVVASYGATETAGGCVYDGVPLPGVQARIADDGRIELSGPMLFDGYADDPGLTAEMLRDGWYRTSDRGEWVGDRLQVLGRLDDVMISGGVKVSADAVAARLREHPAIRDAAVLGIEDPEWGERVVAFVVGELDLAAARDFVAQTLPRAWAPHQLEILERLPLLANGKLDRIGLRVLG